MPKYDRGCTAGYSRGTETFKDWTYKELYLAVLEATAKLCRISKYKVYTVDELREKIQEKLHGLSGRELPAFVWIVAKEIPEEISSTDE